MHLKLMTGKTPSSGQRMIDNYSLALASALVAGQGKVVGQENLVGQGKAVGLESHAGQGKAAGLESHVGQGKAAGHASS